MRRRRRRDDVRELCSGPGKIGEALGIGLEWSGARLDRPPFEVRGHATGWSEAEVVAGPRIGISVATELPWRFCAVGSEFLSRPSRDSAAA